MDINTCNSRNQDNSSIIRTSRLTAIAATSTVTVPNITCPSTSTPATVGTRTTAETTETAMAAATYYSSSESKSGSRSICNNSNNKSVKHSSRQDDKEHFIETPCIVLSSSHIFGMTQWQKLFCIPHIHAHTKLWSSSNNNSAKISEEAAFRAKMAMDGASLPLPSISFPIFNISRYQREVAAAAAAAAAEEGYSIEEPSLCLHHTSIHILCIMIRNMLSHQKGYSPNNKRAPILLPKGEI